MSDSSDVMLGDIESFIQQVVEKLVPQDFVQSKGGRPRILPSFCLWAGMLVGVLRGFSSQLAIWRLLCRTGLWSYPRFPVSDQAVYKRLEKDGYLPLQSLFQKVSALLAEHLPSGARSSLAPFAQEVLAIDETTLDKMARTLPALGAVPSGDSHLLPGKLAGLFDIRRQQWRHIEYVPDPQQNEKVIARDVVRMAPPGSLLLADLGYFGFAWFDWLTEAGYYWISRLRAKTSYEVIHTYYQQGDLFDGLAFLGRYRADRASQAVRLVRFTVGNTTYSYITNVTDPKTLPIAMMAQLYARRWDIELAIKLVKRYLDLHLLWSAKTVIIQQQIWAVLIIAQILQALRLEIAYQADTDPFNVSMELLVQYLPEFARNGENPITAFIEHGWELRFLRPSTRTQIVVPTIPHEALAPLPPGIALSRTPRYAGRRCHLATNQ